MYAVKINSPNCMLGWFGCLGWLCTGIDIDFLVLQFNIFFVPAVVDCVLFYCSAFADRFIRSGIVLQAPRCISAQRLEQTRFCRRDRIDLELRFGGELRHTTPPWFLQDWNLWKARLIFYCMDEVIFKMYTCHLCSSFCNAYGLEITSLVYLQ